VANELIAVSLFSGAGGLDLGVEAAGFRVAAAVERDEDAALTMEKNFHGLASPVIRRDIREVETREILRAGGLKGRERPDLLVGGPPCVAFSKTGFWLDWKREGRDPAAGLLETYARVLREAKPRAFILENVYALVFKNKAARPHFERLLAAISDAGYQWTWEVLNAADYGVPQLRPRVFVVGTRKADRIPAPRLPDATHGGRWEGRLIGNAQRSHMTTGVALKGLRCDPEPGEKVAGKWGHLLSEIPPGDNYLHFTAKRGHPEPVWEWRSRFWSFLLKLDPTRPAPTIQAQPGPYVGPFHWENRRLRVPELRRLFTFPDDFEFVGSRRSVQSQIGNSVPPLVARRVADAMTQTLG
jgi:DNA (cytosine-5)-methyltransferase 1